MFAWLRKYQMWILAFGTGLLMVSFLLEPTLNTLGPNPEKAPVGWVDGRKLTLRDRLVAGSEMDVVRQLHPFLASTLPDDPLIWQLGLHEAQGMGLDAGDYEVQEVISLVAKTWQELGQPARGDVAQIARALKVDPGFVKQSIRHWVIFQNYRELVSGLAHVPFEDRLRDLGTAMTFAQQGMVGFTLALLEESQGKARHSRPLVERFLFDQRSQVRVSLVRIDAERHAGDVPAPTDAEVNALFEQHRNDPEGSSKPYGLGYQHPDRVRIEYLWLPLQRVREGVRVTEAELIAHHEQNADRYTDFAAGAGAPARRLSFVEARDRVLADVRRARAGELASKMMRQAQAMLLEDARKLPVDAEGYRVISAGWEPMALAQVRDRLKAQFNVLPDLRVLDKDWTPVAKLDQLDGLGKSVLTLGNPEQRNAQFFGVEEYVRAARELKPAETHRLITQRLQAHLPSQVMEDRFLGDLFLFRPRAAEPAHTPAAIAEVRNAVERDARRLAAWKRLQAQRGEWESKAARLGMEGLAREAQSAVSSPQAFARRVEGERGALVAPEVEGVGVSEPFVDGVFDLASDLQRAGGLSNPLLNRMGVLPVDSRQSLFAVRVEDFRPLGAKDLPRAANHPLLPRWVRQSLNPTEEGMDPLAAHVIGARLGFVDASGKPLEDPKKLKAEKQDKAAQPAS